MPQALGILLPIDRGNTGYFTQGFDPLTQVKSNFINLIKTRLGERVHQPEFGCRIHEILFEPLSDANMEFAKQSIIQAVQRFMPFLELTQISLVDPSTNREVNTLQIYVRYVFRSNPNVGDTVVINF